MATEIKLPELGEGIAGGEVLNVLVKAGDVVELDQTLLEIETDKAVVEVPSPAAGRIQAVLVQAGQKAKVGQALFEIDGAVGRAPAPAAPPAAAGPGDVTPQRRSLEVTLPELGEGIAGGDVVNVRIAPGEVIEAEQTVIEIETDKAVVEVPSPAAGKVVSVTVKAGEKVKVGAPLFTLETSAGAGPAKPSAPSAPATAAPAAPVAAPVAPVAPPVAASLPAPDYGVVVPAGPAVRRLARELGADLRQVRGSGRFGRITLDDLKAWVRGRLSGGGAAPGPAAPQPLEDFSKYGPVTKKPLSSLRRKIAEQMALAWQVPMVTHFDEVDITELEAWRKGKSPALKEKGASFTITAIAVRAVVTALQEFPAFNSSLDLARGELVEKQHYHIGIAVDTDNGLIVPVIRDADKKSLTDISIELAAIAKKARDRKIGVEELRGATFTISNLGGISGTGFTPIVNPPQVAILGMSRGTMKPVWDGKAFQPRLMMPFCISYDHRVVDGANGARFAGRVAGALTDFGSLPF